jgi:hypothetical protein
MAKRIPTEDQVENFAQRFIYSQIEKIAAKVHDVTEEAMDLTPDEAAFVMQNLLWEIASSDYLSSNKQIIIQGGVKGFKRAEEIWEKLYVAHHESEAIEVPALIKKMFKS